MLYIIHKYNHATVLMLKKINIKKPKRLRERQGGFLAPNSENWRMERIRSRQDIQTQKLSSRSLYVWNNHQEYLSPCTISTLKPEQNLIKNHLIIF